MYLNHDGAGGDFGDVSVSSASADQATVSIYGATRSTDGALTLMVINKTGNEQTSTVTINGFEGVPSVDVFQYSATNLNAIVRPPDALYAGGAISHVFPANSITLLVVSPLTGPATELLTNGGFEAGTDQWTITKPTGEKARCTPANPSKFAKSGVCGLQITGTAGVTTKITQALSTIAGSGGDTIMLSVWAKGKNLNANVQMRLILSTAAGTQTAKLKLSKGIYPFTAKASAIVLDGDLTAGTVQIIVKAGTGKVYVDDLSLLVSTGARTAVLPPPAPSGFRR
jgi:hypothetical protein